MSRWLMLSQFAVSLVFYSAKVKAIKVLGLGLISWIGHGDLDNVTTLVKWSFLSYKSHGVVVTDVLYCFLACRIVLHTCFTENTE